MLSVTITPTCWLTLTSLQIARKVISITKLIIMAVWSAYDSRIKSVFR